MAKAHGCFDLVSRLMKNLDTYTGCKSGVFSRLTNDVAVRANKNPVFDLFGVDNARTEAALPIVIKMRKYLSEQATPSFR